MKIVGTKYCGHDSSLCLLDTKEKSIFAISTERVTRIKHDYMDITPILDAYDLDDVDHACHSYNDFANISHDGELTEKMTYNKEIEKALREIIKPTYASDLGISNKLKKTLIIKSIFYNPSSFIKYYLSKIKRALITESPHRNKTSFTNYIRNNFNKHGLHPYDVSFYEHHLCHATPSYLLSSFCGKKAIAMTIDGQGDGFFSKTYLFNNEKNFKLIGQSAAEFIGNDKFLSIGRIYNHFTEAMDLRANSDEGKVEALAAFGESDTKLLHQLKNATIIDDNKLSISFDIEKITPFYDISWLKSERSRSGDENFCATVQQYLEDTIVSYLNSAHKLYPTSNLCLSGGVAANIIMSLNIYERTPFKNIYVLPPMGDEGLAIGSSILKALELKEDISWLQKYKMPYFGDAYSRESVENALRSFDNIIYTDVLYNWHKLAAKSVAGGKICALFNGKMEFGPRALGNRSIVANPMIENIRDRINSTVKRRPSYQPFCPSILEEERERLFTGSFPHKHMAIAFRMKEEFIGDLPCAVHVDGTARPQFVEEGDNPDYYKYLNELKKITGYGVSINTSFNLHGRTIVRTPYDALTDFIDCNIDELYIEGFRVTRKHHQF